MAKVEETLGEGLSKLAHAIRRSAAAYIAVQLTPASGTLEDWEETADHVAAWIGGNALVAEQAYIEEHGVGTAASPGVAWADRDQA